MENNTFISLLRDYKVVIPPIQRDYAQGRNVGKIPHIRKSFLKDIGTTLTSDSKPPLELDFIYGYVEKDKTSKDEISVFKPLDGQQRLTTLFLLHWYVSVNEDKQESSKHFLKKFSYATRKSSRDFCEQLIDFKPEESSNIPVDVQIINQPWFFYTWKNDPTIQSMLVVLHDMEEILDLKTGNLWVKLTDEEPRILFHLLPMDDLGLPDDLYIKMNARGKGLTDFEHFKSRFSEILDTSSAKEFNQKIDKQWSDLFWNIFKYNTEEDIALEVDSGFLSFFWYISDFLTRKKRIGIESDFWLDRVREVYQGRGETVQYLFDALNLFESFEEDSDSAQDNPYFEDIFYVEKEDFDVLKTRLFFNNPQINLFRKCASTYGYGEKKNSFSVGEQLMLYAFVYMKLNSRFQTDILRYIRNVLASSEDQLRNEYLSTFLYNDIEHIINNFNEVLIQGELTENSKLSRRQCLEETTKSEFLNENPSFRGVFFKLEDHHLLRGNVAIFDFNSTITVYSDIFMEKFRDSNEFINLSRAMLTIGDYGQNYGRLKRYGNKLNSSWRELLTQSEGRKGFENTKIILHRYFDKFIDNPGQSNEDIVVDFLKGHNENHELPKDFRYYMIKYDSFIFWEGNLTNGFYYWENPDQNPYECYMLFRKQFNGRHWDPFLLTLSSLNEHCTIENYGDNLKFVKDDLILMIENQNNGFKIKASDTEGEDFISDKIEKEELNEDGIYLIRQNEEGFDIEDRINSFNSYLNHIG